MWGAAIFPPVNNTSDPVIRPEVCTLNGAAVNVADPNDIPVPGINPTKSSASPDESLSSSITHPPINPALAVINPAVVTLNLLDDINDPGRLLKVLFICQYGALSIPPPSN